MTGLGFDPLSYDIENEEEYFDEEFNRMSKNNMKKEAAEAAEKEKERRKNRIKMDLNSKKNQYEDFSDEECNLLQKIDPLIINFLACIPKITVMNLAL
jgi:hypothetical protein